MNILLSANLHPNVLQSYCNIAKAFVYDNHNVMVWDGKSKPAYDVWDELKPAVFISLSMNETEKKLCDEYGTKHFVANGCVWADPFLYRPIVPTLEQKAAFGCDNCIIINGERKEIEVVRAQLNPPKEPFSISIESACESGFTIKTNAYSTKLFSPHSYHYKQYCGGLPEDLFSLALSCAKTCYATNFLNLFNFTLANEQTIYPLYSKTDYYSRDDVLQRFTGFHGAAEIDTQCKLNIGFLDLYEKFRSEIYCQ